MTLTPVETEAMRFAARVGGMAASEIRALFAVASRPEVVSLAGGMPAVSALPLDDIADLIGDLVRRRGASILQYGSGQGDAQLREAIPDVMSLEGITSRADDVVVTVGSQQGLDLLTRILCDPGDVILAEAPAYVGALGTFNSYQVDVVHVPMDADGLVPADLERAIARLASAGRRPRFLYTVPNFNNPAGVSLAVERRQSVVDICARARIMVIEDNPYGLLGFSGKPRPALRSLDPSVVYLGSFSKTFAPGLRVGWVLAPPQLREKLVLASEASVLCPPGFTQAIVAEYLATAPWRRTVSVFRDLYRSRRDACLAALSSYFPDECSWTVPDGGFYVWVSLPKTVDATEMLPRAVLDKVAYVPGSAFFADGQGRHHLRLSYCYPPEAQIHEGVRRLAGVLDREIADTAPGCRPPVTV